MQLSKLIIALLSTISIVLTGHISAQSPQPIQFLVMILGYLFKYFQILNLPLFSILLVLALTKFIFLKSSILPTNAVGPTVQHDMKKYGMPVVLELTNNTGAALTLYVTFISETIHHNV